MLETRANKKKANKKAHENATSTAELDAAVVQRITLRRISGVTGGARLGQCKANRSIPRNVSLIAKDDNKGNSYPNAMCKSLTPLR